jgi:hypothetical protein
MQMKYRKIELKNKVDNLRLNLFKNSMLRHIFNEFLQKIKKTTFVLI